MNETATKIERLSANIIRYNDDRGMRWYEVDGEKYISVTQVLDCFVPPELKGWFIKNSAKSIEKRKAETAEIGSLIHQNVHLGTEERFNLLAHEKGMKTIKSEFVVTSTLGFAGQVDRMIDMDGKRYIVDIKTGRFGSTAGAQLGAYSIAANQAGADAQGIGVISIPRNGGPAQYFDYSKNFENCQYAFLAAFDFWKFQNYKQLEGWKPFEKRAVLCFEWASVRSKS